MVTLTLRTILGKRKWRGRRRRENEKNNRRAIAEEELNLPNLPEEIVLEILSRLPLKSLVRFTLVSKQWRSLIQSGSVKKSVPQQKILVCEKFSLHSIDEEGHVETLHHPWKNNSSYHYLQICGSCNGLFLIAIYDDLFLWNPLTKCWKKVLSYESLRDDGYRVVSGLCYDSFSNEYKAVMALAHQTPSYGGEFVVVGSFRSKSWTMVRFPYCVRTLKNTGTIVNEHLHWFVSEKRQRGFFLSPHIIVYFDPRINEFKKVPMPEPKDGDGDIIFGLGVLKGCLCMVRAECASYCAGNFEVLAMEEYGKQESWTTMFIISNLPKLHVFDELVPLCFTKNGEVLVKIDPQHINAYNLNDNSQRDIRIPIQGDYYWNATLYEESLVTPSGYNWEEEELRGEATYVEKFLSGTVQKWKKGRNDYWQFVEHEGEEYEEYGSELESDSEEMESESEDEEY